MADALEALKAFRNDMSSMSRPGWGQVIDDAIADMERSRRAAEGPMDVRAIAVECHGKRDILDSLYEAWNRLPPCPMLGVVGGAIQEIQAMRDAAQAGPFGPNNTAARGA